MPTVSVVAGSRIARPDCSPVVRPPDGTFLLASMIVCCGMLKSAGCGIVFTVKSMTVAQP
ncbi:MAG TPA: hypothetical protein VMU81_24260 [Acetobacteraceae bacterium]|nr:hypothetical protein [Acetobacteraceae bacterium]